MSKWKMLPRMAVKGVIQNGTVYYPYLMAGIFSAFTYFIFASILCNDLVATLPHSAYAWMLLLIGKGLLGIILIPFLFYANSFLIKRRTKEFGLYSILGLEKRHIGVLLFCETLLIYLAVISGGILLGTVLAKLFFLLLLKLSNLPVEAEFIFTWQAFAETILFFGFTFAINLVYSLIQVSKSKPVELFSGSRKGEKEPKLVWLYAALGVLVLGTGYAVSIRSQLDEMIFIDFFLAVFLVVAGTYLVFTSGSVLILRILKKNKKFYYQKENFITVSGMLYRMKKNAAGLANICIFSTMVVITLICTVALYGGLEQITHYNYPYDIMLDFASGNLSREQIEEDAGEIIDRNEKQAVRIDIFEVRSLSCRVNGNHADRPVSESRDNNTIYLLTLEDYNRIEGKDQTLSDGQILFYTNGPDLGFDTLDFLGIPLEIKEEPEEIFPYPKAGKSFFDLMYVMVVKDKEAFDLYAGEYAKANGVTDREGFLESTYQKAGILLEGEDALKQETVEALIAWCKEQQGFFASYKDGLEGRSMLRTMYGGLLFIGILFGTVFFMCLLLIMYYKQISEGYEDRGSYEIMQKVGMSDHEIRRTIHRQILLVFFLPLTGAVLHTMAGMFMVNNLMSALQLFDSRLIVTCTAAVLFVFMVIYCISYLRTARTYYKIVN